MKRPFSQTEQNDNQKELTELFTSLVLDKNKRIRIDTVYYACNSSYNICNGDNISKEPCCNDSLKIQETYTYFWNIFGKLNCEHDCGLDETTIRQVKLFQNEIDKIEEMKRFPMNVSITLYTL